MGPLQTQKMFSNDFKLHNECIDLFAHTLQNDPQSLLEILDIIFKWAYIKLSDSSNTQFAVKVLDFFSLLFKTLEELEYSLQDFESYVIVALLADKTGLNNAVLKEKVKKLIKMIYSICDKQKCYSLIIQFGLNNKNMRA